MSDFASLFLSILHDFLLSVKYRGNSDFLLPQLLCKQLTSCCLCHLLEEQIFWLARKCLHENFSMRVNCFLYAPRRDPDKCELV